VCNLHTAALRHALLPLQKPNHGKGAHCVVRDKKNDNKCGGAALTAYQLVYFGGGGLFVYMVANNKCGSACKAEPSRAGPTVGGYQQHLGMPCCFGATATEEEGEGGAEHRWVRQGCHPEVARQGSKRSVL
jgi:hypothetical protein